jgi:hypothetical protein
VLFRFPDEVRYADIHLVCGGHLNAAAVVDMGQMKGVDHAKRGREKFERLHTC